MAWYTSEDAAAYKKERDDIDAKATLLENKIERIKVLLKERIMDAEFKETVFIDYLLTEINK